MSKTDKSELTEAENRSNTGDPESWTKVLESVRPGLQAFLRSRLDQDSDVQDCLQIVAMKAMESGREVLPSARRAWLFKVASNEAALVWRRKAATQKVQDSYSTESSNDIDQLNSLIHDETVMRVREMLKTLPEATQQIIELKIEQNLTFQQIADQLDIPLGTALSQMRRGLAKLRSNFTDEDTDEDNIH